jgi:hypothetical protein
MLLNFVYIYAISPEQMYGVEEIGYLAASNLFGAKLGCFSDWLSRSVSSHLPVL